MVLRSPPRVTTVVLATRRDRLPASLPVTCRSTCYAVHRHWHIMSRGSTSLPAGGVQLYHAKRST